MRKLIDQLADTHQLTKEEWIKVIAFPNIVDNISEKQGSKKEELEHLRQRAVAFQKQYYGNQVYTRALIEFTNYCKNNCRYCGIRRDNQKVNRYRLSKEEILDCCRQGYELDFRTFVLQGGEDRYFTEERMADIISSIRKTYPDCAITLSLGEWEKASYQRFFDAGADRYLLRHETADEEHYQKLHPKEMSLQNRMECLWNLKEIGYQVGCGFMVGSPGQTAETLAEDMLFLTELQPAMVGIGPFVPHHQTPFAEEEQGTVEQTLHMLSLIRLLLPKVLLPATTALGTIDPKGREKGIQAGANVVMPNVSPVSVRKKYELYDNKICTGDEAAECRMCLANRMQGIGYEIVASRGDSRM